MMKIYRNPPDIHPPVAAYTHQIEIRGSERMLVLSGQLGMDTRGEVPDDPGEQLALALENLILNLRHAEMDVEDIIKMTVYLVGEMDGAKRREVIGSKLGDHKPCMTLVFVAALASSRYRVEIDAWASKAAEDC